MQSLSEKIREYALRLGYSKVGIMEARNFSEYQDILQSRGSDYEFLTQKASSIPQAQIKDLHPEAKSIIVFAWDYLQKTPPEKLVGKIGRAYLGQSYNPLPESIHGARFQLMEAFLEKEGCKIFRDVFIPYRIAAAHSGVATIGRNNFAYIDSLGSFVILYAIVVDQELEYDTPTLECKCPTGCSRCKDACPTGSLKDAFHMEPKSCLGFNAWVTRKEVGCGITDSIPLDIREKMGTQIHGCDICQEVCPRNQMKLKAAAPSDPFLEKIAEDFSYTALLHMKDDFYESRVRPIMYNYIKEPRYFQRNAAVALGNAKDPANIPDLAEEFSHPDEMVRSHIAWALGKIGGSEAFAILTQKKVYEDSSEVLLEIENALGKIKNILT